MSVAAILVLNIIRLHGWAVMVVAAVMVGYIQVVKDVMTMMAFARGLAITVYHSHDRALRLGHDCLHGHDVTCLFLGIDPRVSWLGRDHRHDRDGLELLQRQEFNWKLHQVLEVALCQLFTRGKHMGVQY